MQIRKTTTTGEPIPINVNVNGKNLLANLVNLRAYKLQQLPINFCWLIDNEKIDGETFLKSNSLLMEFIPDNQNISKLWELEKHSLMEFTKIDNNIYKIFILIRLKVCSSFKQYLLLAQKTKEYFKCSKFYLWYRFTGRENEIIRTSILDDIQTMLGDELCEV